MSNELTNSKGTDMDIKAQAKTTISVILAIADVIREAGQIPAGHLYAALLGCGGDMTSFNIILNYLTGAGVVRRDGDLLVWIPQH